MGIPSATAPRICRGRWPVSCRRGFPPAPPPSPAAPGRVPSFPANRDASHRQTGRRRGHRQTHRHPAILLLAHLPAVLPRHAHRVRAFFHEPRIIHHPSDDRPLLRHRAQGVFPNLPQHAFVAPGRIRHHVVQRLVGPPHVVGSQTGRHRFHTLPLSGKQQARAISLQWLLPVSMPCGLRQAVEIGRKAFLLCAWRHKVGAHEMSISYFITQ